MQPWLTNVELLGAILHHLKVNDGCWIVVVCICYCMSTSCTHQHLGDLINAKLKTSHYNIQCLNQLGLHIRIELDDIQIFWMIKLSCLYLNAPWLLSHVRDINNQGYIFNHFVQMAKNSQSEKLEHTRCIICWNLQAKQHRQSATLWGTQIVLEYFLVVWNASK